MKTGLGALALIAAMILITSTASNGADYNGTLRVYMTETVSRWTDHEGHKYDNALLDFATQEAINVPDNSVYTSTLIWNSASAGYGDLLASNYAATAVIFIDTSVVTDAYDPLGFWFDAYYSDAAAQATPGKAGANLVSPGYTHTVFVEEGTANW